MKRLKQLLAILLALMMVLSVTACRQDPDVTTAPGGDDSIGGDTAPTTSGDSVSATTEPIVLDIDLTQPWRAQTKMNLNAQQYGAFSDVGYYYTAGGGRLYFMDTINGISVILCHNAGCKHEDADCEAYIPGCMIMFYGNGHIYYNKHVPYDRSGIHLFRRNPYGTAEEKIGTLGQEYADEDISIYVGEFIACENAAYFTAYISQAIKHEDGSIEMRSRDMILVRLDLKTGKQEELGWFADTQLRLIGCRDDALLYYTLQLPSAEDIFSEDYAQQMQSVPARLRVWSGSAGGSVTLLDKPLKEFSFLKGLHDGKLLYSKEGIHETWAYDLGTGEDAVYDLEPSSVLVNENYIEDSSEVDEYKQVYSKLLDLRTGKHIVSEYDDADISVRNVTDRGMIIEINYEGIPCLNDLGQLTTPRLRDIFAYVSFDAIEDGLQESDLLVISDKTYED